MSGGYFEYKQHGIHDIADAIERKIAENSEYSVDTIQEFKNGVIALKKAGVYAQRIDWLFSDDDGEESFHRRLKEELGGTL